MRIHVRAAGAIVWRRRGRKIEVLLVHRPTWNDWSIPKGKVKGVETLPECCVREIKEETGVDIVLGIPIDVQRYRLPGGKRKEVRYWLAQELSEAHLLRARPAIKRAPRSEVDKVIWCDVRTARKKLSTAADRTTLEKAVAAINAGAAEYVVKIWVRHARARKRASWAGEESDRPLTRSGQRRAAGVNAILSAYGVRDLVTSPWKRCAHTLRSYARSSRIVLRKCPALTETAYLHHPDAFANEIKTIMCTQDSLAACVHRPTLPAILDILGRYAKPAIRRRFPADDPWLKTAEVLVVHTLPSQSQPRIVAVERFRPADSCGQTGK
ncbi:NUDIX hydrolase [Trueperella sp. LYQ141]|uniref:NUDIX hydrolase n=1 Tax=Trueperella sp. LYQ141 TaxID=3391058 RepID=UPI003982F3C5